jgi:beta-lactamase superfamily II metal-dependent hydrolase
MPRRVRVMLRWGLAALAVVILLGGLGATAPALAAPRGQIAFLDVGVGGEATLLRLANGVTVLIDGGANGPALEEALTARLPFWQRSLDLAVLTDPSAGDEMGLQDATAHYQVGQAVDGGMLHPSAVYLAWLDALSRASIPHARVRQDDTIQLAADATLRVLSPPQTLFPPANGTTAASDDLILRLQTPGLSVLFLGNADAYALDALAFSGEPLAADVVEVALAPATGLNLDSPLGKVILAAHPRLVIITQAPKAAHAAPHVGATSTDIWPPDGPTAESLGAPIMRTSDAGTITLAERPDGGWDAQNG